MAARRRSRRRRPLTEPAERSPGHALVVWVVKTSLLLAASVLAYVVIMNLIIPAYIDQMVREATN